jgi:hypothetical protein
MSSSTLRRRDQHCQCFSLSSGVARALEELSFSLPTANLPQCPSHCSKPTKSPLTRAVAPAWKTTSDANTSACRLAFLETYHDPRACPSDCRLAKSPQIPTWFTLKSPMKTCQSGIVREGPMSVLQTPFVPGFNFETSSTSIAILLCETESPLFPLTQNSRLHQPMQKDLCPAWSRSE